MKLDYKWKISVITAVLFGFGEIVILLGSVYVWGNFLIGVTHWYVSPVFWLSEWAGHFRLGLLGIVTGSVLFFVFLGILEGRFLLSKLEGDYTKLVFFEFVAFGITCLVITLIGLLLVNVYPPGGLI